MTTQPEALRSLEEVLPLLGDEYKQWKEHEKAKEKYKLEFFALANEQLRRRGLALKLVEISALSEESAVERAQRHYPTWTIDTHRPHRVLKDVYEIVLMEDPTKMAFSEEHEGVKFSRSVAKGPVLVDDAWMQEEAPDLYAAVTFELPWGDRIMKPVDKLDAELIGALSKYIYNDKPRISLGAPRAVKTEEE